MSLICESNLYEIFYRGYLNLCKNSPSVIVELIYKTIEKSKYV